MIGVGVVGLGFMGRKHLGIYAESAKARVVAVCDTDEKKLAGDWGDALGNIEQASGKGLDLTDVAGYSQFEDLLSDAAVEVVDITLPTNLHAEFATKALEAGKHVLLEKPIALTLDQADMILRAVHSSGRRFMVAHCIRFWPEYSLVREMLSQQRYGRIRSATFRRMSAIPIWGWKNWLLDQKKSGGVCVDMHIHDIDYINYLFGLPVAVSSCGVVGDSGRIDHVFTCYHYGQEGLMVAAESAWLEQSAYPFVMSFDIACDQAMIEYNSGRTDALRVYTHEGKVETPEVSGPDGYTNEIDYFLDCVAGSTDPVVVTPTEAREALQVALAEIESIQSGRRVDVKRT